MWIGQSQVQGLYTKLNMTPQLIQAMNVLQMATADLNVYIREQMLENPCMEVVEDSDDISFRRQYGAGSPARTRSRDDDLIQAGEQEETLEMSLLSQLRMSGIPNQVYRIARYLAGNLDDNGYLRLSVEEAAAHLRQSNRLVEEAIVALQSLDPAGVGARTLQECLRIQIKRDPDADPYAAAIVDIYLQEVASGNFRRISGGLGIDLTEVEQSVEYIRRLNPRPGSAFARDASMQIVPDAIVRKEQDRYVLVMKDSNVPSIRLNSHYRNLAGNSREPQTRQYLRHHIDTARSLIRSLEQRKLTLSRVVGAIVEEQRAFLERGIDGLRPMNLRTIADRLQLHESTVSRAVQNKYVQMPGGIYALNYFFTNGLPTNDGELASAESVKAKIRRQIDEENKTSPLSDQQITDRLVADGLQISRRTVMKYREELGVLSSRHRARR